MWRSFATVKRKVAAVYCLLFTSFFLSAGARPSIMDPYFKRQCLHSSLSSQDEEFGIAGQHFDFCEHCSSHLDHGSPWWHPQRTSHTKECFLAASGKTIRKNQKSFLEYTVDPSPKRRCQVRSEKSTKTKTSTKMVQVPNTWLSIVLLVWTLMWNIKKWKRRPFLDGFRIELMIRIPNFEMLYWQKPKIILFRNPRSG